MMNGLVSDLMDAQADLQTALGLYRLRVPEGERDEPVEDRLMQALARLHTRLDILGHPMYDPATHPAIPQGPTPVVLMEDIQVHRITTGPNQPTIVKITHQP